MTRPTGRMWIRKSTTVRMRVTKREKHRWRERAEACGQSLSAWIRTVVTNGRDALGKGLKP